MIHYDDLIKAEKMGYFSDYETLLFARAKGKIKSVIGVLPLTFTSKGGNMADWVISGNQQGVGERTENLFDIPNITVTGNNNYYAGYSFSGTLATTILTEINANIGSQYSWYINIDTEYTGNVFIMLILFYADGTYGSFINPHKFTPAKEVARVELRAEYDSENGKGYQYTLSDITLVKGSTVPTSYIPYGYQIPLTVSQDGQTDKTYDIYIGDTPLTEGETVSKTSTGVDIELFEGENTVSTTLYNKPEMKIKYK